MKPIIFVNPNDLIQESLAEKLAIPEVYLTKLKAENRRMEFLDHSGFLFFIILIPEYNKKLKVIVQVELDILYDKTTNQAYLFFLNSDNFANRYNQILSSIKYDNYSDLIYEVLQIIQDDEIKIIDHIQNDTSIIKDEYYSKIGAEILIRHLTNNQINISGIKLILSNQIKFIDYSKQFLSENQYRNLTYKQFEIKDELNYASEFSETLMKSINTKFEVKTSMDIYTWTKYTFIAILGTFIYDIFSVFIGHTPYVWISWVVATFLCAVIGYITLSKFKRD